jgi:hypothetical protein
MSTGDRVRGGTGAVASVVAVGSASGVSMCVIVGAVCWLLWRLLECEVPTLDTLAAGPTGVASRPSSLEGP